MNLHWLNDAIYWEFLDNFPSVNTRDAYRNDLEDFTRTFGTKPEVWTLRDFISFRDKLTNDQLAPNTIRRKLSSVISFVRWCKQRNLIVNDPTYGLKLPKTQVSKPTLAFTDAEVSSMLNLPDAATRGKLHRLLLMFLFHLGLRRSEVARIQIGDITDNRGVKVLTIKGKGSKIRELPLNETLYTAFLEYSTLREADLGRSLVSGDFLFTINEKPLNSTTVFRIVQRYAELAGVTRRVGAHSCRATAISHLLDTQQMPIRDVADFAGHASINTTALYDKKRKGLQQSAAYKINYG